MRLFALKYNLVLLFFLMISFASKGQVLDTAKINLNAGGYINDVIYDQWHDCYIVVGNFTSIDFVARKNIAFIDRATLTVENASYLIPITNIDDEIYSVAIARTFLSGIFTYHLYLGGNFEVVTVGASNYTRKGIVKLTANQNSIAPYTHSNFAVSGWNADLDMIPHFTGNTADGVDDILITNDTVIFSGQFYGVNNSTTGEQRDGLAAYTLQGMLLSYPNLASSGTYTLSHYYCIEKSGANLFIGGIIPQPGTYDGRLFKLDANGNIMAGFNYGYGNLNCVYGIELFEDSLLMVAEDVGALDAEPNNIRVVRKSNGTEKLDHSLFASGGTIAGIGDAKQSLDVYMNYIYVTTSNPGNSLISFESVVGAPPVTAPNWNGAATNNLVSNPHGKVHIARNKLFVSSSNLATLSGQSRLRLGAYCLEPGNPKNFTLYDTTICPEDTITYAIPAVNYADGYKWEYTGTGGFVIGLGSLSGPVFVSGTSGNSVQIVFQGNFSPGQLSVTPYTDCNGLTKVFSNSSVININTNPLPHVNAGNDTVINCYNEVTGIELYGYSDSAVVEYTWLDPNPFLNVDGQYKTALVSGNYIFRVKNAIGCPNYDTVFVTMDTISPVAIPPLPPYIINCANPVVDFLGSSSNSNVVTEWFQGATQFPNPISIGAEGGYTFQVTDTLNGCTAETAIYVDSDYDVPNIEILGYPFLNVAEPIDELTCYESSLTLTSFSDTSNTTVSWINADTTIFYGDTYTITSPGNYFLFATNNDNGCTNSLGINIAASLNNPNAVAPADGLLNCSADSLVLDGSSLVAGALTQWTGTAIPLSADPVIVYNAGTYFFTVTDTSNGCIAVDSVVITQDNSITVSAGADVLACENQSVVLSAVYSGNISGINYLWNNSEATQNAVYAVGSQPYAAVEVMGDGGCYGTDTVFLNSPPVPVILFEGFQPCDDGATGQIVASPVSGMEPFTYSIDNGISFQSAPVFSGLVVGNYPILVHDSLNCEYNFSAVIDENSSLPNPAFLFSTYNFESDTVAIVDVSNPPADSVLWIFPNEIVVLDNNPELPIIILPDTGIFEITMNAYYGSCLISMSKMIYASPYDSTAASLYNLNGIKSVELYPNPTTGNFTVEVEFYKSQRAALVVQDMIGTSYFYEEYDESLLILQDISLENSVIDGTYVLRIVSEFDGASVTFILAR